MKGVDAFLLAIVPCILYLLAVVLLIVLLDDVKRESDLHPFATTRPCIERRTIEVREEDVNDLIWIELY